VTASTGRAQAGASFLLGLTATRRFRSATALALAAFSRPPDLEAHARRNHGQQGPSQQPRTKERGHPANAIAIPEASQPLPGRIERRSSEGGVLLVGRLDGTQALAILDAEDPGTAQERFAPQLENIGPYVLDEWFASDQLARMVD